MIILYTFIIAVFLSSALLPGLIRFASSRRLVDIPDNRKVHTGEIPRIGGVAIALGALLPLLFWMPFDRQVASILAGALIVHLFGIADDIHGLSYRYKFIGQVLAVAIVIFGGDVVVRNYPIIGNAIGSETFHVLFTMFALIGITNAINLSDGLDGLAGGASLMSFVTIAILAYMGGNLTFTLMAVAISGGIMGFLRYNTHPAQIFMGDGGSQLLGFLLGCLVIVLTQNINTALSPSIALLLLGLPVLDTLTVMARRIYERRAPFSPDMTHIHHKLLNIGLSHHGVVFVIYMVQSVMVVSAYVFRYYSDLFLLLLYGAMCLAILVFFKLAEMRGWKLSPASRAPVEKGFVERKKLDYSPAMLIKLCVLFFLLSGVWLVRDNPLWVRVMFGGVAVLHLLSFRMVTRYRLHIIRLGYYLAGIYLLFVMDNRSGSASVENYLHGFVILLAVLTAIGIKITDKTRFSITTLDYLIILIMILVPSLPIQEIAGKQISMFALHLLGFFYALEYMFAARTRKNDFSPLPGLVIATAFMLG